MKIYDLSIEELHRLIKEIPGKRNLLKHLGIKNGPLDHHISSFEICGKQLDYMSLIKLDVADLKDINKIVVIPLRSLTITELNDIISLPLSKYAICARLGVDYETLDRYIKSYVKGPQLLDYARFKMLPVTSLKDFRLKELPIAGSRETSQQVSPKKRQLDVGSIPLDKDQRKRMTVRKADESVFLGGDEVSRALDDYSLLPPAGMSGAGNTDNPTLGFDLDADAFLTSPSLPQAVETGEFSPLPLLSFPLHELGMFAKTGECNKLDGNQLTVRATTKEEIDAMLAELGPLEFSTEEKVDIEAMLAVLASSL